MAHAAPVLRALPSPLTRLIGREREAAEVRRTLRRSDVRLVTPTGPGGVGKTRLALQVASESQGDFADGVAFVALAPMRDPDLVAATIAGALGWGGGGERDAVERLVPRLRDRQVLLVLDNFEQVVAAAPVVADLLARCPRSKALVTSRAWRVVSGEHDYPLSPLALPELREPPSQDRLEHYPATRLFVEHSRPVDPHHDLGQRKRRIDL